MRARQVLVAPALRFGKLRSLIGPLLRRLGRALVVAVAVTLVSGSVFAQAARVDAAASDRVPPPPRGEPLIWNPAWPRVQLYEYVLLGAGAALALGTFGSKVDDSSTREGILPFDNAVRDTLRASTPGGRRFARDGSDVLVALAVSYPILGDALINAAWYRDSPSVAWQLAWIDLEVSAITLGLTSLSKTLVGGQRPYGRDCGTEVHPETRDCTDDSRYYTHFSGHTSASFAAAAVTCMHHAYLPLWGDTPAWVACSGGFGVAATTGMLRVVADRHYVSDVLVGAVVGSAVGLLVPWLHYRHGAPTRADWVSRHRLMVLPTRNGAAVTGVF